MGWIRRVFGLEPKAEEQHEVAAQTFKFPSTGIGFDGSTFYQGVQGQIDEISTLDYWTLRKRSAALFYTNTYGRGIIRRFVTNVINTGLTVECTPEEQVLGLEEDSLVDWSEITENRYNLYGQAKDIIDAKGYRTDGTLQRQIYTEALVCGDCLVIPRIHEPTGLPQIQIVNGDRVQTPPERFMEENLVDGVKLDELGRHLGYWVYQGTNEIFDDKWTYIPAYGAGSGRRTAWMVYGPDKREDGIRGEPLLGIAIQPLKEISDYRGSAQLKASINSMIIGFIKRTMDKPGSYSLSGSAIKKSEIQDIPSDAANPISLSKILPGIYMERLQPGEEPVPYSIHGTDVNFGAFETAVVAGLAWALEIPPEILLLSFNSNYGASQAALQEFKLFLNKERPRFAEQHCQNLFEEWFISELIAGDVEAPGLLEAYYNPRMYAIARAWMLTDWNGAIKPSVDIVKQTTGYKVMTTEGWITNDRTARELTGTKWSKNIQRLRKENEMKAEALKPLLELKKQYGDQAVDAMLNAGWLGAYLAQSQKESEVES